MVAAPSPARDTAALYAPLLARGISRDTLSSFAVTLCTRYDYPYWRYPVRPAAGPVLAWRYKRAGDDAGRRKYDWGTEREPDPARPGQRCPPPCATAVYNIVAVRAGLDAYVVAGEPDTWLMSSLGLRACSLLAGEGAVPDAAVDEIAARRPAHLTIIYDNDQAGHTGACALLRAAQARGLAAGARALPLDVGAKGDVTDLYRLCGQDRAAFVERLGALPPLAITTERAQPHAARRRPPMATGAGASPIERFKARHDLVDVIEAAGVPLRSHQGGAYLQGCCPFHEDRSPSFVVWPQRGYFKCYGCGERGDVLDFIKRRETGR